MLTLDFQLRLVGAVAIAVGAGHLLLPRLLGWPGDLASSTPMTRMTARLHSGLVGLACALFGALSLPTSALLAGGTLAVVVLSAQVLFWGARWLSELLVVRTVIRTASTPLQLAHLAGLLGWAWLAVVPAIALTRTV